MNGVYCLNCETTIVSEYGHDFKWCACEDRNTFGVFVDGGPSYRRRGFGDQAAWVELRDDGTLEDVVNPWGAPYVQGDDST